MILYKVLKILILDKCIEKFFDNLYFNTKILPKLKPNELKWTIKWGKYSSMSDVVYDYSRFIDAYHRNLVKGNPCKTIMSNLYGNTITNNGFDNTITG